VCFTPRHDAHFAQMPARAVRRVIDAWATEYAGLAASPDVRAITIFENRGRAMGASSPHPHGQIWANESIPSEMLKERAAFASYLRRRNACLLCTYLERETSLGERVIAQNEHFCALVPYWAGWPFEVLLMPQRHIGAIDRLAGEERDALAELLRELAGAFDALFDAAFPYSMGWHQQPVDAQDSADWHMHAHYFPPLLRSASVRKYFVGYELLGEPQRDITPEYAAWRLREAWQKSNSDGGERACI